MSEPRPREENPYASPHADTQSGRTATSDNPDLIVIDPWIPPRNAVDLLAGLWAEFTILSPFIVLAGIFGFFVFGVIGMLVGMALGTFMVLPAWLIDGVVLARSNAPLPFFGVLRLSVHAAGIDFHRLLWRPKSLRWEQLISIRPARPRDVFILGWLLLPLGRELTATKSIHGHYKIRWRGNFSFFPPQDPALFRDAIERFQPRLLAEDES